MDKMIGFEKFLLQEDAARLDDGYIENRFVLASGRHVRPRGQDFVEGEEVLPEGSVLDAEFRPLAWAQPGVIYDLLLRCSWDTVRTFSQNDKQLQGTPGAIAVLHTNTRRLETATNSGGSPGRTWTAPRG